MFSPGAWASLGLLGLLFLFYPDLFLVKAAPLTGDHLEQHYPWAYLLSQSLRQFKLPFWTPLIHCGFPLVAESQVGAFYIPNLLMYFFLPFQVAYSYMNLVHWFVAGWGTYLYAREMKLDPMAAFVAAVVFTFGSAYGGAYYNMTSLKTICWFPLALCFLERYLEKFRRRYLTGMALLIGQSIVAGYLQMAALTWMMFGVYAVIRVLMFPGKMFSWTSKAVIFGALAMSAAGALILAFPQIFLTFQLALQSNRTGLAEGYAYVGSMSPLTLSTLINPILSVVTRGCNLYAGSFSLFLMAVSLCSSEARKSSLFRIWTVLTLLAFFLALGRWSPLYVAVIKFTRFYSFRMPSKFLGFFCFGFAMLAAAGFQSLWRGRDPFPPVKRASRVFIAILALYAVLMTSANLALSFGRDTVLRLGEAYVKRFVYAQPGHPHSLDSYLEVVRNYPGTLLKYFSLTAPANIVCAITLLGCLLLILILMRKKTQPKPLLLAGLVFLVIDLYGASFADIRGDLATYKVALAVTPVRRVLEQEKSAGRLGRLYGFRQPAQRLPLVPSQNVLYGIADIGVYSPFVLSRYYQTIGLFGNINDSNFAATPTPAFVCQRLPVLSFLNVTHVLSTEALVHPGLSLIFSDRRSGLFLYANLAIPRAAYFISGFKVAETWGDLRTEFMKEGFDPTKTLLLEKAEAVKYGLSQEAPLRESEQGAFVLRLLAQNEKGSAWNIYAPGKGFLVLPDLYYPGWVAKVNGIKTPILRADGMFRALEISGPGAYRVEIDYAPGRREPS